MSKLRTLFSGVRQVAARFPTDLAVDTAVSIVYLATAGERRAAGHVDGDCTKSVAEQRVDTTSVEQELQSVERSPIVRSHTPAATVPVRYHCGQNTT